MIQQPESTGIRVHGTSLSEEETAALLAVVNTQLTEDPPAQPAVDDATLHRVTSTWTDTDSWQDLPQGY